MLLESESVEEFCFYSSYERQRTALDRLMLAVLLDALTSFQRGLDSRVRADLEKHREVDSWLRSRDHDSLFSFESVCSVLNIDADYLRGALNEVRRKALAECPATRARKGTPRKIYTPRAN